MSNVREVLLQWRGEGLEFHGHGTIPESPSVEIDSDSGSGPSPSQQLLLAAGSCAAVDVVMILQKMRVDLEKVSVRVRGTRREDYPRRFVAVHLAFEVSGTGLNRSKADRAVQLSVEKYCSVLHTLAGDLDISYDVAVV